MVRPLVDGCGHLHARTHEPCGEHAEYVIPYGFDGVGACAKHLGQQIRWAMETRGETRVYTRSAWVDYGLDQHHAAGPRYPLGSRADGSAHED